VATEYYWLYVVLQLFTGKNKISETEKILLTSSKNLVKWATDITFKLCEVYYGKKEPPSSRSV